MVDPVLDSGHLLQVLRQYPQPSHYLVAYSGGLDSHVLLLLMHELAGDLPTGFSAVHINHGIQDEAGRWQAHCETVCRELDIELAGITIDARSHGGAGPEAHARQLRYREFGAMMKKDTMLLTAHHRDDQAETLLYQLFRGSGPAGLAAMPACKTFGPGWHARPLLDFPREEIRRYAVSNGLQWIEDASNTDLDLDRNFIRHQVVPLLQARWPAAGRTLARAAEHQATASGLLKQLAQLDIDMARDDDDGSLRIDALRQLDDRRIANGLRYWLELNGAPVPGSAHIRHMIADIIHGRTDSEARVRWGGTEVRAHRGRLCLLETATGFDPRFNRDQRYNWDLSEELSLANGELRATRISGRGLSATALADHQVEVRFRRGGEKIKPAGRCHTRDLKKLLQEAGIEPWRRDHLPLIYLDDQLVVVPGLCVAEGYAAQDDHPG